MSFKKKLGRKKPDNRFVAKYDKDVKWEEAAANELLALPKGLKMKIFGYDPVMRRIDLKVKFPKGYVEPRHSHKSWHSILVTRGRMCVAGKDLRPGDYVFGWDQPHGPYEYPDGCEVYVVFMGEGTQHVWDEDEFLHHRTLWKAESAAGKKAVARGEEVRKHEREKKVAKKITPTKKKTAKKIPSRGVTVRRVKARK
ncbi:MAG: cupin domain-containing protein [Thermodesulfobacteriota bacterium]